MSKIERMVMFLCAMSLFYTEFRAYRAEHKVKILEEARKSVCEQMARNYSSGRVAMLQADGTDYFGCEIDGGKIRYFLQERAPDSGRQP